MQWCSHKKCHCGYLNVSLNLLKPAVTDFFFGDLVTGKTSCEQKN